MKRKITSISWYEEDAKALALIASELRMNQSEAIRHLIQEAKKNEILRQKIRSAYLKEQTQAFLIRKGLISPNEIDLEDTQPAECTNSREETKIKYGYFVGKKNKTNDNDENPNNWSEAKKRAYIAYMNMRH